VDFPITHLLMHSLTHAHARAHTHTAAEATTVAGQFSNCCILCNLDQNSRMLSVMIMEHDIENIMLIPGPLNFWFHCLFMHQTEQFSLNVLC
jgi:hypothetical protein